MHLRTVIIAALVMMFPRAASATPAFPDVIAAHLELAAPPACSLCHNGTPARGTVTTPFGTSMRSRGAQAYDEASIHAALDALAAEKKDSDGDGISDVDELKAGADPNSGPGGTVTPEYGCSATKGSAAASAGWLVLAVFAFASLQSRRARRKA